MARSSPRRKSHDQITAANRSPPEASSSFDDPAQRSAGLASIEPVGKMTPGPPNAGGDAPETMLPETPCSRKPCPPTTSRRVRPL